jgi:hypothetical protein
MHHLERTVETLVNPARPTPRFLDRGGEAGLSGRCGDGPDVPGRRFSMAAVGETKSGENEQGREQEREMFAVRVDFHF